MAKTLTVILSDGTKLKGLTVNGDHFVSREPVSAETFAGKLGRVEIKGDPEADELGMIGEHGEMRVEAIHHFTKAVHGLEDGYYFVLRDVPAGDVEVERVRADVEYVAMMTGVEL